MFRGNGSKKTWALYSVAAMLLCNALSSIIKHRFNFVFIFIFIFIYSFCFFFFLSFPSLMVIVFFSSALYSFTFFPSAFTRSSLWCSWSFLLLFFFSFNFFLFFYYFFIMKLDCARALLMSSLLGSIMPQLMSSHRAVLWIFFFFSFQTNSSPRSHDRNLPPRHLIVVWSTSSS